jgi:L-arabinose isomerase
VAFKPVAKTPQEVTDFCQQANTAANCIGLITWCHTFSPSKMWINGLKLLRKPIAHLHTQHNREIPWNTIDMDFMNLNQSAHGDREHGFIMSRMRLNRKVVVGFWQDQGVQQQLGAWCRVAAAWHDWQGAKFCRFGDNMREVAVTEGDWKTCALVRAMKVMAAGLKGGTSFMEDYTYHFSPKGHLVLGAHMLEICPTIAKGKPSLEVHPLGIGGKADPARFVFNTPPGPGLNASLIDLGNRFRLLVNEVEVVAPEKPLPKLPVARALWAPKPSLTLGAAAWICAGGAHHTGFSQAVTVEMIEDFADIARIELVLINEETNLRRFKQELRWNEVYYGLRSGWDS